MNGTEPITQVRTREASAIDAETRAVSDAEMAGGITPHASVVSLARALPGAAPGGAIGVGSRRRSASVLPFPRFRSRCVPFLLVRGEVG
jgi:hypothetical protein